MIKVYQNSVRASAPDPHGARAVVIGEIATLVYAGCLAGAIAKLKAIGIGHSVAVRYPGGMRSCMNKPQLWADLEAMPRHERLNAPRGWYMEDEG